MELQTAAVAHRLAELRRLAGVLRLERRRNARERRVSPLRAAVGRRLVALGAALLDEPRPNLRTAPRT